MYRKPYTTKYTIEAFNGDGESKYAFHDVPWFRICSLVESITAEGLAAIVEREEEEGEE